MYGADDPSPCLLFCGVVVRPFRAGPATGAALRAAPGALWLSRGPLPYRQPQSGGWLSAAGPPLCGPCALLQHTSCFTEQVHFHFPSLMF